MKIKTPRITIIFLFIFTLSGCIPSINTFNAIRSGDEQKAYELVSTNSFNKYKIPGLLVSAVTRNQNRVVQALMKQEDIHLAIKRFRTGNTQINPLYIAIHNENTEIIKMLVHGGFDVNRTSWAVGHRFTTELAKQTYEVEMNRLPMHMLTPLQFAIQEGKIKSAETLLQLGANINRQTYLRKTPMFLAAKHRRINSIKFLLKHGVRLSNVNNKINRETTTIQAAKYGGHEMLLFLSQHGFSDQELQRRKARHKKIVCSGKLARNIVGNRYNDVHNFDDPLLYSPFVIFNCNNISYRLAGLTLNSTLARENILPMRSPSDDIINGPIGLIPTSYPPNYLIHIEGDHYGDVTRGALVVHVTKIKIDRR